MKKLSDRALIILQHIADRSRDGRKWLSGHARGMDDHDEPSGCYLNIGGSGDASILRSLVSSGLLERDPPKHSCSNQYQWLRATSAGRGLLQDNADRVASVRAELTASRRRYEYALAKLRGYEESELRQDYPEFYQGD